MPILLISLILNVAIQAGEFYHFFFYFLIVIHAFTSPKDLPVSFIKIILNNFTPSLNKKKIRRNLKKNCSHFFVEKILLLNLTIKKWAINSQSFVTKVYLIIQTLTVDNPFK